MQEEAKKNNEGKLVKTAIFAGVKYGKDRGAVELVPTDSASKKILYIYRLLIHDKLIKPYPKIRSRNKP